MEDKGLLLDIKTIKADIAKLQCDIDKIADFSGEDAVIKMEDVNELKGDVFYTQKDIETISGFIHLMGRNIDSLEHRTTMNLAKHMRNQLIFGGVKSSANQEPLAALTTFLRNIIKIVPEDSDILEANYLGEGYKKTIRDKEINFPPPPVRARCREYFAQKVMNNVFKLAGKKDQEEGFKYYVRRCRPESHRAVRDKYAAEVRQYKLDNKNKAEKDKIPIRFDGNNFIVNNVVIEQDITPPTF